MLTRAEGQYLSFLSLLILSFLLFRGPLVILGGVLRDDDYSHVLFVPVISACLVYFRRKVVFQQSKYCVWGALPVLFGIAFSFIKQPLLFSDRNDYLSFSVFAIVFFWVAAFILCFGLMPLRAALFPLCFLVLMVPMPTIMLDQAVADLQKGSADTTDILFRILGVPAVWHGRVFFVERLLLRDRKRVQRHSFVPRLVRHQHPRRPFVRAISVGKGVLFFTCYPGRDIQERRTHCHDLGPYRLCRWGILQWLAPPEWWGSVLACRNGDSGAVTFSSAKSRDVRRERQPKHKVISNCASYSGIAEP